MSANTILTSIVTGGTNSHATVSEEANAVATDFVTQGVVGAITLNTGSGGTGSFCVNADASPDMGVTVKAGKAYITATPSSQNSQVLRARASTDYTAYTINANASGSTKYDWIYLSVSATNANNPDSAADNVTSLVTSRSTSNTSDTGSPPTYGLLLAIVTVANGASSITNSNITDSRFNASVGAQNGSLIVTQSATGQDAKIQAAGIDANVNISLLPKGTGYVKIPNLYKFSVYRSSAYTQGGSLAKVTYDTKTFDTSSNFDVVTNFRFVAPVNGFYWFAAAAAFSPVNGTGYQIALYKNGTVIKQNGILPSTSSGFTVGLEVGGFLQLTATDYIEVFFRGNPGDPLITGEQFTSFDGFLVSAT